MKIYFSHHGYNVGGDRLLRFTYLLLFIAGSAFQLQAQEAPRGTQETPRGVLSPAGETATHERVSLSWTLGDISSGYYLTPGMQYREGFQSAPLRVTRVTSAPSVWEINVYPNPSSSIVEVDFGAVHPSCDLKLYDLTGREVRSIDVAAGTLQTQLQLGSLSVGTYILRVVNADGSSAGSYQIKKIH